jgi:hypothetical protein
LPKFPTPFLSNVSVSLDRWLCDIPSRSSERRSLDMFVESLPVNFDLFLSLRNCAVCSSRRKWAPFSYPNTESCGGRLPVRSRPAFPLPATLTSDVRTPISGSRYKRFCGAARDLGTAPAPAPYRTRQYSNPKALNQGLCGTLYHGRHSAPCLRGSSSSILSHKAVIAKCWKLDLV